MKPMDMSDAQRELYEKARDRIERQVPDWLDEYPGDPMLAVLELAVVLSDLQNQRFEQIEDRHYLSFLKLLDSSPRQLCPARLLAKSGGVGVVWQGQRFLINDVPFEVTDTGKNIGVIDHIGFCEKPGQATSKAGLPVTIRNSTNILKIAFTAPLPIGEKVRLWCGVTPEPGRIPPDGSTDPPIRLYGVLPNGEEFQIEDGTCGLLKSGFWSFVLSEAVDRFEVHMSGQLEGTPLISVLVLEPVHLAQQRTRSAVIDRASLLCTPRDWPEQLRAFVPEGDGWREITGFRPDDKDVFDWRKDLPGNARIVAAESDFRCEFSLRSIAEERVFLREEGILPYSLHLMIEEDGMWYDCPVRKPDPSQTLRRGCRWDSQNRELCFGDGRDFQIPKEGRLLIAGCICTLGAAGNGAGGGLEDSGVRLTSLHPASGGQDAETPRAAFTRIAREQSDQLRLLAPEDYAYKAKQTPGLALEKVLAISNKPDPGVTVYAKPKSNEEQPELTAWQSTQLQRWLDRFRTIGVPVTIRKPQYIPVSVSVTVHTSRHVPLDTMRKTARLLTDGIVGPLDFGGTLSQPALFAALGAVPGVQAVESLELQAVGAGLRQNKDGTIQLKPDMLPWLSHFQVIEA